MKVVVRCAHNRVTKADMEREIERLFQENKDLRVSEGHLRDELNLARQQSSSQDMDTMVDIWKKAVEEKIKAEERAEEYRIALMESDCRVDELEKQLEWVRDKNDEWAAVAQGLRNTIDEMKKNFGTNPEDLICAVGPVIGRCCYEIDSACAEHFKALSEIDYKLVLDEKPNGKFMADLALTNKLLLLHAGVKEENIVVSDLCTQCNSELLWSHRATKGQRGTMAAFMQILY